MFPDKAPPSAGVDEFDVHPRSLPLIVARAPHPFARAPQKAQAVSSTLLLIAIVGAYVPTIFSQLYARWNYKCERCFDYYSALNTTTMYVEVASNCVNCHYD